MLIGRRNNIRAIIKSESHKEINSLNLNLSKSILYLANNYTGAKFDNPLTEQQLETVKDCTRFVIEEFPMLSIDEIRKAFQMAAARKFQNVSLKAYFGLFNNEILGSVLAAYLVCRRAVIAQCDKIEAEIRRKEDRLLQLKRNDDTRSEIVEKYKAVKSKFEENGDIEELELSVYPFWGKILVEEGIITFTHKQKQQIVKEAKDLTRIDINKEIVNSNDARRRRSLKSILGEISVGIDNDSFESMWKVKYAKLVVIKSIIN